MNDFDRAARYAVKEAPAEALRWLLPGLSVLMYQRWLDAQSAPRPGEPDRRCDTIMELTDPDGKRPPWAFVVELFTEPDADAVIRALEYLARFRGELRHGPHGHDRYPFAVAMVFLTGAPRETRLRMNVPGMEEVGLWFAPRVMDISGQDAVAHLDAIEQNTLPRWLLVWTPLMRGGQEIDVARRWRTLAESDHRLATMATRARIFARLAGCEAIWREALEGIMIRVAPIMEEARDEGRIEARRQDLLDFAEARFPGAVPQAVLDRIRAETDLDKLASWIKLLGAAQTAGEFQSKM